MSKKEQPSTKVTPRDTAQPACPCSSGLALRNCCAPFISGTLQAPTAQALMRSRYTAYTTNNEAYLRTTWDERTLPAEALVHTEKTQWLGLEIKAHEEQGNTASVEFVARYKIGGRAHRLHEISRFSRYDGKWFYVDGIFPKK